MIQLKNNIKYGVLAVLLTTLSTVNCMAQRIVNAFGLDNYTIPMNGSEVIGKIISKTALLNKPKIVNDTSGLFTIGKNNVLKLKRKVKINDHPGYKYKITIKSGTDEVDFLLVKDQFKHNKVIAHRGAWKNTNETENSIGSLKGAMKLGCEGSEFDVHMSADSVIFIHHDAEINGIKIEKTLSADLQNIKLPNSEPLPTLDAFLKLGVTQNSTRLFLEIKSSIVSQDRTLALTERTVALVHSLNAQAWIYYISFNYDALKRVHELDPAAKLAYLGGDKSPEQLKADQMDGLDYYFDIFIKNDKLISQAHSLGLTTNIWTVNGVNDLQILLNAGVDRITTNEPELLFSLLH